MCKILIMAGIQSENMETAKKFSVAMGKKMSETEKDGLGYAAVSNEGEIFGERWLYNAAAFSYRNEVTQFDKEVMENYEGALRKPDIYNKFGSVNEKFSAIILHARWATSSKGFLNTHPFVWEDGRGNPETALIHNGVIRNIKKGDLLQSTCDSEKILNLYCQADVSRTPDMIQLVADDLQGYYACGVITKDVDNIPVIDVFKDSQARLYAFLIKGLDGPIFATSETNVAEVCQDLGLDILSHYEVAAGHLMRFNAITGKLILTQKFSVLYSGGYSPKKGESVLASGSEENLSVETDEWQKDANGYWRRMIR